MSGLTRIAAACCALGVVVACGEDPVSQARTDQSPTLAVLNSQDQHGSRHVTILDDCDVTDPGWGPTGGCALRNGAVSEQEFGMLLTSPLSESVIGHLAWRNEPSYLRVRTGTTVRVTNQGGRTHTFTPVAAFGGGRVPPFNIGLTMAPECAPGGTDPWLVAPGGHVEVADLSPGNHSFQCCFHPWMRAQIKVE